MHTIQIVGAGPGAEDLITLRGLKALEQADFVLYAGSLVNPKLLAYCKKDCVTKDSSCLTLEEQIAAMTEYAQQGKKVVRLHTGDPSVFGAINEQIRLLKQNGLEYEIIPGVSSVFGAAASLGLELTSPETSQSVVLTRTPGRTPMPEKEKAAAFAQTGATLVFFLSTGNIKELMTDLHENGGLSPDTPAAVVYRATWEEERILRGTVATIAKQAEEAGFGRQALIFVGKALAAQENGTSSKLYAENFSHGYRNFLDSETFYGTSAVYAFSRQGLAKAKEIMQGLHLPCTLYSVYDDDGAHKIGHGKTQELAEKNWKKFDAHIFVGAAGIAVRSIASCLTGKSTDPAVVSCSDTGSHVISLVSGHIGGANRLARKIARITGGQACVSTATDSHGLIGIDEAAMLEQARILNPEAIKTINSALLNKEKIAFTGKKEIFEKYLKNSSAVFLTENTENLPCVCWDTEHCDFSKKNTLYIQSKAFVLGIGCKKDIDFGLLEKSFLSFLKENSLTPEHIAKLTSCTVKKEEKALLRLAEAYHIPLEFYSQEELNQAEVPNPSEKAEREIGARSVAEASALLGAGYPNVLRPYREKTRFENAVTFSLARLPHRQDCGRRGLMSVVGLGSGSRRHITPEVLDIIKNCDVIAGYTPYVDFIRSLAEDKPIIQNGMMGEMARCEKAMSEAQKGRHVCMVCSGDPGILAMAGLLLELRKNTPEFCDIDINIYAGITSANIAAASLGAPLQNGFCLVSLSDLLVPTDEVRQNLKAVCQSALPIALYNPAGKKRRDLLFEAMDIFRQARGENTLCAYVKNAGRDNEEKWVGTIKDFPFNDVDMSTLLIIGGERTQFDGTYLYEARGYMDKYKKN